MSDMIVSRPEADALTRRAGRAGGALALLPFLQLACAGLAGLLWDQDPGRGWVVAIAVAPLALRLAARRRPIPRTAMDGAVVLFLVSVAIGLWAGYNRAGRLPVEPWMMPPGWQWVWGVAVSLAVFYALAGIERREGLAWAMWVFAGLGVLLTGWFLLANEWRLNAVQVPAIEHLGYAIQARFPMPEWVPRPNPNQVGALLAMFWLLGLGTAAEGLGSRSPGRRLAWGAGGLAAAAIMTGGLIVTLSRGAWLALGCGAVLAAAWALAAWAARRARWGPSGKLGVALLAVEIVAIGAIAVVAARPGLQVSLLTYAQKGVVDRPTLYAEALRVARDYPFTGAGLGAFAPVHATYVLLTATPNMVHAHNWFLHVLAEQGVVGLAALAAMVGVAGAVGVRALARARRVDPLLLAAVAALAAEVAHGAVDYPLHGNRAAVFMWVPAGLVIAAAGGAGRRALRGHPAFRPSNHLRIAGAVFALALLVAALCGRSIAAAWEANLGALAQTRAELGAYDWRQAGEQPIEAVRRAADLGAAEAHFRRALALEPGNATALDRLALVALARGRTDEALALAEAAWAAGHRDRVTRLVYGRALAATGQAARAAEVRDGLRSGAER